MSHYTKYSLWLNLLFVCSPQGLLCHHTRQHHPVPARACSWGLAYCASHPSMGFMHINAVNPHDSLWAGPISIPTSRWGNRGTEMLSTFPKARNLTDQGVGTQIFLKHTSETVWAGREKNALRTKPAHRSLCVYLFSSHQRGPCWARRASCPSRLACWCPAGTGRLESWSSVFGTTRHSRLRMGRAHWLYCFWGDEKKKAKWYSRSYLQTLTQKIRQSWNV